MDVIVVGGGCIGLALAGELADTHDVTLIEKDRVGRGASHAAAGMLAPVMEAEFGEEELLDLCLSSHRRYPEFVEELESETGREVGFRSEGTLGLAFDQAGVADLDRQADYLDRLGLEHQKLDAEAVRDLEPRVSNYVSKGILVDSEYQVDNRRLVEALELRCRNRGVAIRENEPVERFEVTDGRVQSVRTSDSSYSADEYLLCAGAYSGQLEGLPEGDCPPVRPVKGQSLSVALSNPPEVEHVLRSPDVYCVPKDDGRLVVGATMEEEGYDTRVTAGAVLDLLHDAYEMIPFVYENELLETWAGLRPASRDSLPVLGPAAETENLTLATGHYRNGILLTPITVQLITAWIEDRSVPDKLGPFLPERFK